MRSSTTSLPAPRHTPVRRRRRAGVTRTPRHQPCRVHTDIDTRYLDQDGDGLLDAVEVTEHLVAEGPDFRRVLSSRRVLLGEVGDDGVAHSVAVEPAA